MTDLRDLRLKFCGILDSSAIALIKSLPAWGSLERLDVRFVERGEVFDDTLASALAFAASTHRSLKRINLLHEPMGRYLRFEHLQQRLQQLAGDRCVLA